ncbi:MAG TPA: hypothetical protein VFJ47_13845 [Terriglobales bacterium]|nr:hypothetical protein [Terriglobales bacterium]
MIRKNCAWVLAFLSVWFAAVCLAGTSAQTGASSELPPAELVRITVHNEIKAADDLASPRHMFRSRKQTGHGSQTKLLVETKDGMVGLVLAYDDRPLTPDQRQAEQERIQHYLNDPKEMQKKRKREKEDADRTLQILKALPDAFLFEADGTEPGKEGMGKPGEELVRLKFRPNPRYDPPTRVEQVLTGMQGRLLIDANRHRIALIDGTLFKDVGFGWGILGHLDKGGHFLVQQGDVGDGAWDATRMNLSFTGKIMMFKNLRIQSDEVLSDFTPVASDLTFAQGVELLKKQQAVLAENKQGSGGK